MVERDDGTAGDALRMRGQDQAYATEYDSRCDPRGR